MYPDKKNTAEGYEERYAAHYEQMECLHRMLGNIFDRLAKDGKFDEMTIIIHGDHGSRISLNHEPYLVWVIDRP